jgi:hypothetical protein
VLLFGKRPVADNESTSTESLRSGIDKSLIFIVRTSVMFNDPTSNATAEGIPAFLPKGFPPKSYQVIFTVPDTDSHRSEVTVTFNCPVVEFQYGATIIGSKIFLAT